MDPKLESEINEKLEEAKRLTTKKGFPFNYFYTYDPCRAGDLFSQAGDIYLSQNYFLQASQEYLNAAEAYKLSKDDVVKSFTAQAYYKAGNIFSGKHLYVPNKAVECFILSSDYYGYRGNLSLAASRRINAADILIKELDYEGASDLLQTVNDLYEKAGMPSNRNLNLDKYLSCLLKSKRYTMAGEVCMEMATRKGREDMTNYYLMVAYFCFYVEGRDEEKSEVANVVSGEEKDIIECLHANTEGPSFEEKTLKYAKIRNVKEEISDLIADVKKMSAPEFNIL